MDDKNDALSVQRSPISLSFLFYLVTFGAIISACLRTLSQDEKVTAASLQVLIGWGAILGASMGAAIGIFAFRSFTLAGILSLSGLGIGIIAGALAMVNSQRFLEISTVACLGSWLVIVVMTLVARSARIPQI